MRLRKQPNFELKEFLQNERAEWRRGWALVSSQVEGEGELAHREQDRYAVRVTSGHGNGLEQFEITAASESEALEKATTVAGTDQLTISLLKAPRPRAGFLKTLAALWAAFLQDPDTPAKRVRQRARQARQLANKARISGKGAKAGTPGRRGKVEEPARSGKADSTGMMRRGRTGPPEKAERTGATQPRK